MDAILRICMAQSGDPPPNRISPLDEGGLEPLPAAGELQAAYSGIKKGLVN